MINKTNGLMFRMPSFLIGVGSIFNIFGGNLRRQQYSPSEIDRMAIESDWQMVGQDLSQAIKIVEIEIEAEKAKQLEFDFNSN